MTRLGVAGTLGALMMIGAAPGYAQAGITATDPNGGAPGEHFTDLVMVPGDTNTASLVVAQDTGESVQAGLRFESLSELGVLHEAVEFTVEGLGTSSTMSLDEAMDTESPFWLGELPSGQEAEVTLTAHLPYEAGNETQRTAAAFNVIVTARDSALDPPEEPETPSPGDEPDRDDPPEHPTDEEEHPEGLDRAERPEQPEQRGAAPPQQWLPQTGAEVFLLILIAGALIAAGTITRRAAHRTHQ